MKKTRTMNKFRGFQENINHKARTLGLSKKKFKIMQKIFKRGLFELSVEYMAFDFTYKQVKESLYLCLL